MARKTARRTRRSSRRMHGGAGAADHVIASVGGIGQQMPVGGTNVLAQHPVGGTVVVAANAGVPVGAQVGGNGIITNLAVPAVFIAARRSFGKRYSNKHSRRRSHRRRRH